jgi:hypothetical protein
MHYFILLFPVSKENLRIINFELLYYDSIFSNLKIVTDVASSYFARIGSFCNGCGERTVRNRRAVARRRDGGFPTKHRRFRAAEARS